MPRPVEVWLAAGVRMPKGSRAIVSICNDGGQASVLLLEAA